MSRLTDEQRQIALDTKRHLMVEAGAGSGKTTLLIEKIAHELGHGNIPGERPHRSLTLEQIAAITFTRKAAGEIKERLRQEFLRQAEAAQGADRERWAERAFRIDEALIGTIDSFAGRIIRDFGALAGVESGYEVLDPGDATALRLEAVEETLLAGIDHGEPGAVFLVRQFGFLRARSVLSAFLEQAALLTELEAHLTSKRIRWAEIAQKLGFELETTDYLLESHARDILRFACEAQKRYRARLERDGLLDHAHVVLKAAEIAAYPAVQTAFQKRIKLVFVDEHQDTDAAQVRLLFRLTGISAAIQDKTQPKPTTRLVLIGDPKQGIYGFRHADITMWNTSRKAIERVGGRYYTLTQNHRSRPTLVRFIDDAFSRIMNEGDNANAYEVAFQGLLPTRPETSEPGVELLLTPERGVAATAAAVANRIQDMLARPAEYPVYERDANGQERPRPLRARDIAILSRNLKGVADHYEQALRVRGIRSYVYGGRGLYNRQEIQDLAMLLRAVVDPYDPFALSAFLRSPLGGVDDHTLAELAAACTKQTSANSENLTLYEALRQAKHIISDAQRAEAAVEAAALLEELRSLRDRLPHHQLLEIAIERTGFITFLAGAPDAPAGIRNVEKLLRIARRAAREPLSEFVRRLDARVSRADPEDEAPLYAPDDDLITISTIHKAKGLEWPYVFVVGIDEPLFRTVATDMPHLVRHFGVVMPLDVVVHDEDGRTAIPEQGSTWTWYVDEAKRRNYAEAKRLFYVATTRARDRLILAGALRENKAERRLTRAIGALQTQTTDHWLRYLYPEIVRPDAQEFRYGQDAGVICRATPDVGSIPTAQPGAALPVVRDWPALVQIEGQIPCADATWGDAIDRRLAPVADRAAIRDEFSASEILKYAICSWQHMYGYIHSISSPTIEIATGDALVNQILPEKRGDILHDYLREHQDGWSPEQMHHEIKRILLRHLPMADEEADQNTKELIQHVTNYLQSEWYERVRKARRIFREVPVIVQMNGYRLRVKLDLLFEEEDGWRILDFKTALFRGLEHRIREVVEERARDYEIQAGIYTLAAKEVGCDVKEFIFFFTAPAIATSVRPTKAWLRKQETRVDMIVRKIQVMQHDDVPVWGERRCKGCEYLPICQPLGAPPDVLAEAGV